MEGLNFRQLRFVIAVADIGSFTKAADDYCITQPALSNAISQLEDELGGKLFERKTRFVKLTKCGGPMISDMRNVISAQAGLISNASVFDMRNKRTLRVGISPLISEEFVENLLARMEKRDPLVTIVLTEMNKTDIPQAIDGGGIDFGLGPVCLTTGPFQKQLIYGKPLHYVARECSNKPVPLGDLEDQPLILVADDCGLAETVRTLFRDHQIRLKEYEGRALSYHILEKWALLGIGPTFLPASKVSNISHAWPIDENSGSFASIKYQATLGALTGHATKFFQYDRQFQI